MGRRGSARLAGTVALPAVTILMPVEQRRPGNPADPLRLRELVSDAVARTDARDGPDASARLRRHLDRVAREIDWTHPGAGLVVLATPQHASWYALPFPVRERVVVDERFATGGVLADLARAPQYRVLVLSLATSRLFQGRGAHLNEVTRAGFPVVAQDRTEADTPHRDLPIHDQRTAAARQAFRAVDAALGEATRGRPLPLVIVGTTRDVAHFEEVASHARNVAGHVAGSHEDTTAPELAELVAPAVEGIVARRCAAALDRLDAAIGAKRAALGLDEVRAAAREGRGLLLLVEEGAPLDGHVDEAVELVTRGGGTVVHVPPGTLAARDGVAMVLRY